MGQVGVKFVRSQKPSLAAETVSDEILVPEEKKYLELHETCNNGHSMHYFHGRPPGRDLKSRYSATCHLCNKMVLENQPYFMHCYECAYDVCSACSKLEVHFDQVEQTKCKRMHAMKIHRGYLKKTETVACDKCKEEKSLEKAPYFFHCFRCNENKCLTCSRHDIFVNHQFASFADTEENFLLAALEFNKEKLRNELHLYITLWDSEVSAPKHVREIQCIKLNLRDRTVAYDDDSIYQVENTDKKLDTWKEFVLQVVPLAKIAHVRIEYYNTHINKGGYPVYKNSRRGDAYCGKSVHDNGKTCNEKEQCDDCQHFTRRVKTEPKHSWWSEVPHTVGSVAGTVASVASGVLDSIPVVGHLKGVVEYGLGYKEAAKHSFETAIRSTVVMGAGAAEFCLGVPMGAVGAGVAAGVLFDAAESCTDSAIHKKWTPHGEMKAFTNIVQRKSTWWDYASLGMDTVFDGLGGDAGVDIFKSAFKGGMEKGLAGEIERDFDLKVAEVVSKSASPRVSERVIPEFPPESRRNYYLSKDRWTQRGTKLDETDPILRAAFEELELSSKEDFDDFDGKREDSEADVKPLLNNKNWAPNGQKLSIKDIRRNVHDKKSKVMKCELTGVKLKHGMKHIRVRAVQRKNVDHALECQMFVKIWNSMEEGSYSKSTVSNAKSILINWQNSLANLWVLNAEKNIRKRDATIALMAHGANLRGKDAYKKALMCRQRFSQAEADKIIVKIKSAFENLSQIAKQHGNGKEMLIKKFVLQAQKELLIPKLWYP